MARSASAGNLDGMGSGRSTGGPPAIVAAGIEVIAAKGYGAATIRDIAKRARMSTANLYHHFGSKRELLFYIMDASLDDLLLQSENALAEAGDDPEARLRALVGIHVKLHAQRAKGSRITNQEIRHLPPAQQRALREKMKEQQRKFDRVVEAGVASGAFAADHDDARALASMCTAVATWFNPRGELTPEAVAERYQELAFKMLRKT
jgi:AcrR family transcriptional regulator